MEGLLKCVWARILDGPRDEMGTMKTAETPYEHRGFLKPPLAGVTKTVLCARTRPTKRWYRDRDSEFSRTRLPRADFAGLLICLDALMTTISDASMQLRSQGARENQQSFILAEFFAVQ